jgi:hypothetical protein
MKQKLKLLFAFLRGFKTDLAFTSITLLENRIEDWDVKFDITNNSKEKKLKLPSSLEKIIEELIKEYYDDIMVYTNLEYDEIWYLDITIHPFENKLIFESWCKKRTQKFFEKDFEVKNLSDTIQEDIRYIQEENPNLTKFEYRFTGENYDGNTYDVEFDNRNITIDENLDEMLWRLTYEIVAKIIGSGWYEEEGGYGDVTVFGNDIFVSFYKNEHKYVKTDMRIEIT